MILGITGCPGSGKSVLAGIISEHGWILLDADKIGREVVEDNPDVLTELALAFGSDIIEKGKLNRQLLAKRAFSQPDKTQILNTITHPHLIKRLRVLIDDARSGNCDCVVDCALIFEWGIEKLFDIVVCVSSDEKLRKKRLKDRDDRSLEEIEGLFTAQLSEYEKMQKADIVIKNTDSIENMTMFGMMLGEIHRFY